MIALRRFLALLLIPVFLVLFLATLLVFRVNDTFLEASFYSETFETLDVFNFVYDEGIPFALEEAVESGAFDPDDVPFGIDVTPSVVTARVKAVLPPKWVEENVLAVIEAAIPYLTGATDEFDVAVSLDERIEAATVVIKEIILEAAIHQYIIDTVIEEQLSGKDEIEGLPYGLTLGKAQITDGIVRVIPEAWLKEQLTDIIDDVTPYVLGQSDTFTITIPLKERATDAIEVVDDWVQASLDGGAYDYLMSKQIVPVIQETLAGGGVLPVEVSFTDEEIVEAIGVLLPPEWLGARVSEAIDEIGPYLTSETTGFTLVLPLPDRTEVASGLVELIWDALPTCSAAPLLEFLQSPSSLPECRLPISYQQLKDGIGAGFLQAVEDDIAGQLPADVTITDMQIFDTVGENTPVEIEDVREILRDGYTFTEVDLNNLILEQASSSREGRELLEVIENVRGYLRDGFNFDEADLQAELGSEVDFGMFDDIRGYVGLGLDYLVWLVVFPLFVVFLIGVLGGRRLESRLTWMGATLLIAGGLAAVALGPVAEFGFEIGDDYTRGGMPPAFVPMVLETRLALQDSFLAPVASQSATAAASGMGLMLLGLTLGGKKRRKVRVAAVGKKWEASAAKESRELLDDLKENLKDE